MVAAFYLFPESWLLDLSPVLVHTQSIGQSTQYMGVSSVTDTSMVKEHNRFSEISAY